MNRMYRTLSLLGNKIHCINNEILNTYIFYLKMSNVHGIHNIFITISFRCPLRYRLVKNITRKTQWDDAMVNGKKKKKIDDIYSPSLSHNLHLSICASHCLIVIR